MQQTKQLKDYTETELKAIGFDIQKDLARLQNDYQILNQELARRQQEFTQPPTGTEPVETGEVTGTYEPTK